MKTKKIERKLVLNKKTIANVTSESMKKVQGGIPSDPFCSVAPTICIGVLDTDNSCFVGNSCLISVCPDIPCP